MIDFKNLAIQSKPNKYHWLQFCLGPLVGGSIFFLMQHYLVEMKISAMAGIVAWMAIWWFTNSIPLAITALMPVVTYPIFDIMSSSQTCGNYANSVIALFLGGFTLAIAIQRWDLHKYIAYSIMAFVGTKVHMLILGFMISTAFLSMWISNTAAAMLMVSIAMAVISELENKFDNDRDKKNFSTALLLAIAYSASIGGTATIIGTPPNLILMEIYSQLFNDSQSISFSSWLINITPFAFIVLILVWLFLVKIFSLTKDLGHATAIIIKDKKKEFSKLSYEQKIVSIIFGITVILWLTRQDIDLGFTQIHGWNNFFNHRFNDGTIAIFMASLLFWIPAKNSKGFLWIKNEDACKILEWKDLQNFPWNILLLFGGGFALADGIVESGLSSWLSLLFDNLEGLNHLLIIFLIVIALKFISEFASNTAAAQIIFPVIATFAISMHLDPISLIIHAAH